MKKRIEEFILKVSKDSHNFLFVVNLIIFLLIISFITPTLNPNFDLFLNLNLKNLYQNFLTQISSPILYLILSILIGVIFYFGNIFLSWLGFPLIFLVFLLIEYINFLSFIFLRSGSISLLNIPKGEYKGFALFLSSLPHTLLSSFGFFLSLALGLGILLSFTVFVYRILKDKFPKVKPITLKIITFSIFNLLPHLILLYFIVRPIYNEVKLFSFRGPLLILIVVYLFSIGNHFFSLIQNELKVYKDKKPQDYFVSKLNEVIPYSILGVVLIVVGIILENTFDFRVLLPILNKINFSQNITRVLNILTGAIYIAAIIIPFWYVFFRSKKWAKVILSKRKEVKKKK
ncbi:MAG: hypothetical protein QMD25_05270 [Caldisericia bacterium]|nr:hypothetical protein [Caldisericia bacterium]